MCIKKHRNIVSQKSTCDKCNRKSEQVNLSQFEDVHTKESTNDFYFSALGDKINCLL